MMSFVMDYGQFDAACRACDHPDECDMLGYCALDLPSGHGEVDAPLSDDRSHPTAFAPSQEAERDA